MFIDDNALIISQAQENLSPDKIFVMPDYKFNESVQSKDVYHVKTLVSDLKDEDFTKAVQEYKTGQKIKREGERREA
jgi:hypothetical protein